VRAVDASVMDHDVEWQVIQAFDELRAGIGAGDIEPMQVEAGVVGEGGQVLRGWPR